MNVTDAMVREINNIIGGQAVVAHFLTQTAGGPFIIYGMDDPQRTYLAVHHFGSRAGQGVGVVTVGAINRRAIGVGHRHQGRFDKKESPLVSNYFLHFNPRDVTVERNQTGALELNRPDQGGDAAREAARRGFTIKFKGSNFSLVSIGNGPEKALKGVRKDKGREVHTQVLNVQAHNGALRNFAVRRACKFLIYEAIAEGKKIVYALDDMDLPAVADKQWRDWDTQTFVDRSTLTAHSRAKLPVCTTEIREIFRGWDFLRRHVTFYLGFKRVDPPWDRLADREAWGTYARYLAKKMLLQNRLSPLVGSCRENLEWCMSTALASDAIKRYHLSHASVVRGKHGIVRPGTDAV